MYLLYDFLFLIYAFLYLPYLLITRRGYAGFGMRFGVFPAQIERQIKAKANIWLHAVSVGEVMVIDGFIDQLKEVYPGYQMVVTVTTKTGFTLAHDRLSTRALVIPSPIDFSFIAGFFVSLIDPKIYIAAETEIWPNLFKKLYDKKVPMVVINGRISDHSFGRYKAIRFFLKDVISQVQLWCMQSKKDAERIMFLGAEPSRVDVTGNIKFDDMHQMTDQSIGKMIGNKEDLWWVAGSTHPGEEEIVLDVFGKIIKDDPKWRLIIAPRHVERVPQIIELISRRGFKAVKLSLIREGAGDDGGNQAVIVVDTIGDLRSLYPLASLVFVGKSLCSGGGHNIIEPAYCSKAIVIGPKFWNFRDIAACFKEANAIVQVEDVRSFESAVKGLCADPVKRVNLGVAAKNVIAANQGASRRSLKRLAGFLK